MRRIGWFVTGLMVATVAATVLAADEECCFTNPRYTGVCTVKPAQDETCADILAYLNNMNSVGKAYCGNTTVRGGWTQVDCEEGQGRAVCESGPSEAASPVSRAVEAPPLS